MTVEQSSNDLDITLVVSSTLTVEQSSNDVDITLVVSSTLTVERYLLLIVDYQLKVCVWAILARPSSV